MPGDEGRAQAGARAELATHGSATIASGLSMVDHLLSALASSARLQLVVDTAPGAVDEAVAAAGRALGDALAPLLRTATASGRGWAWLPADEALAGAVLELSDRPQLVTNADFSRQRVGGLGTDVVTRFLGQLAEGAGLNVHIRVLEGRDPEHVLLAIFKALGAALGQACRPSEG